MIFSRNFDENNYEIRCPKCCFYISLELSKKQNNLVINCENCGKSDMSIEDFDSTMKKNSSKTCKFCCKDFKTSMMFISENNYNYFICQNCFQTLKKNNEINESEYLQIKDLGKYCRKHKKEKIIFFCINCNKHICEECRKEHENHKIKNIMDESKSKNEIERLKQICKDEDENLLKEKKIYYDILSNMKKRFEKIKKNHEDILALKKLLFDIYDSNSHNY